jgi:predicted glutamine amidotransferase
MSSRAPATVDYSLERFSRHGGLEGPAKDGWGVAYYEDEDVRLIKDTRCASESPWVAFLEGQALRSRMVISHIRRATRGALTLENTQPFRRELGGRVHVFAHNGDLGGIGADLPLGRLGCHRPLGTTDSELAFCALLARLEAVWRVPRPAPELGRRFDIVARFAADLRSLGPANFLYADGDVLFAHGHRRIQADGEIRPPGLWVLQRTCPSDEPAVRSNGLTISAESQAVVLLASVPLTREAWRPLAEGEVLAVAAGSVIPSSPAAR